MEKIMEKIKATTVRKGKKVEVEIEVGKMYNIDVNTKPVEVIAIVKDGANTVVVYKSDKAGYGIKLDDSFAFLVSFVADELRAIESC